MALLRNEKSLDQWGRKIVKITDELDPELEQWSFPPLFKISEKKEQIWVVGFNGEEITTHWGQIKVQDHSSKIVTNSLSKLRVSKKGNSKESIESERPEEFETKSGNDLQYTSIAVEPKGGKTLQEQAFQEMKYNYTKKWREGYRTKGQKAPILVKLMKGAKYEIGKTKLSPKFGIERKIDGIRGSARLEGNKVTFISYGNKQMRSFPHLEPHFLNLAMYLPAGAIIDFEFYKHKTEFTHIQSIVTTRESDHPDLESIQAWIFDYFHVSFETYGVRRKTLLQAFENIDTDKLVLVPGTVGRSEQDILDEMKVALEEGYEGLVVKRMSCGAGEGTQAYKRSTYHPNGGHCTHIYKVKNFDDDEGIITEVGEARGREKGKVMFKVRDRRGNIFRLRMRGTFEQREKWFKEGDKLLGKIVTYSYMGLSPDGVPRMPVGKCIREESDMDPKELAALKPKPRRRVVVNEDD